MMAENYYEETIKGGGMTGAVALTRLEETKACHSLITRTHHAMNTTTEDLRRYFYRERLKFVESNGLKNIVPWKCELIIFGVVIELASRAFGLDKEGED